MAPVNPINIASQEPYCPFDILHDLDRFELSTHRFGPDSDPVFAYRVQGEAKDVVKVFLHGVGSKWSAWSPLLQAAQGTSVLDGAILFDLPGFGASSGQASHLSVETAGRKIIEIVQELSALPPVLIGHSMGGFLALDIASRATQDIASVVAISGAYSSVLRTAQHPLSSLRENPASALSYLAIRGLSSLGPVAPLLANSAYRLGLMPALVRGSTARPHDLKESVLAGMAGAVNPKAFVRASQNASKYSIAEVWSSIRCQVVSTYGSFDSLVPTTDSNEMLRALPAAQIVNFEGAGHFAHVEQPYAVLDQIERFG